MNRLNRFALTGAAALAFAAGASLLVSVTTAVAEEPPSNQDMQLPPGWTPEDMQKMMEAGTPGEMHKFLAESIGTWRAETTMWMAPGAEPIKSTGTSKASPMMDGRYIKVEMSGEMPGMGMYNGFGIYGFNNLTEQFESTWIDNHSTGMMRGDGELASDGTTLTWTYNYMCPLTDKPCVMREIERVTGKNTKTLEMHGTDPKSGKEYKMMEIKFTRVGSERAS